MRKSPVAASRNSPTTVRPRATKHLYRPASAEHVVRHLGSPISRPKPFFVFAGKDFFQQTTNYAPSYQKALATSVRFSRDIRSIIVVFSSFKQSGSRLSNYSDVTDGSDVVPSQAVEPGLSLVFG